MKKYIIVGLGNFGSSLAIKLTNAGNEVFGADSILSRVDAIQEKITSAAMLDCTDFNAIKSALPYKDTDCVIVAIGEDIGASILVNATFKQLNVKRIMSRVISDTHQRVLEAIGITEFVHPEEETASRLTEVLSLTGAMDVYSLFDKHKVVEVKLPERYFGKKVIETDIRQKYHLNVLTVIKKVQHKTLLGKIKEKQEVLDYVTPDTLLEVGDIIVVFGRSSDLKNFVND